MSSEATWSERDAKAQAGKATWSESAAWSGRASGAQDDADDADEEMDEDVWRNWTGSTGEAPDFADDDEHHNKKQDCDMFENPSEPIAPQALLMYELASMMILLLWPFQPGQT